MNIDKRKLTIQILSIIGFALTIKLAMIYYVANYEKYALSSFCSINDFIDCDGRHAHERHGQRDQHERM